MEYTDVQGVAVPALGFGTWQITGSACREAVADALAIGYRHLDTARAYQNEDEVGRAMKDAAVPRDQIFLTTKIWTDEFAPDRLIPAAEDSLKNLQTDYVDLLLLHWPNEDVPLEQTLKALHTAQQRGLTRFIGVSNFPPAWLKRTESQVRIFSNQVEYHPFLSQDELLELARENDHLLTAYMPLAQGRVASDPALTAIGQKHGKSGSQVALRWLIQQDHVVAIPKAATPEHRRSNFDVFDFKLTDEEMEQIHALDQQLRLANPAWAPDWER